MAEHISELVSAKEIAEHTVRTLLSVAKYPEFAPGSVPVAVAAKVFGKDACWVQAGIISGWLPIGCATLEKEKITSLEQLVPGKRANYYISPKLLWELTGYIWKGRENND